MSQNTTPGNSRDFSGTSGFVLGGTGSNHTQGTLDDFRAYDRALLESEIQELTVTPGTMYDCHRILDATRWNKK